MLFELLVESNGDVSSSDEQEATEGASGANRLFSFVSVNSFGSSDQGQVHDDGRDLVLNGTAS